MIMTNIYDPIPDDFGDHPVFDDKDLFQEMWKGPFIVGHMDEVFIPTREELFALFKYWYQSAQEDQRFLEMQYASSWVQSQDYALRRAGLIEKFLPEKEVNAVIKELREQDLEIRKKMRAEEESRK